MTGKLPGVWDFERRKEETMEGVYRDSRGWTYQVMGGLGEDCYKARHQRPEHSGSSTGWKCVSSLPWRKTSGEAQADLDELAARKGWTPVTGGVQF